MPIHFNELDVIPKACGLHSALIVPCQMCPAITVAVKEDKPFLNLFKYFLKSKPFERYIKNLQSELKKIGVDTDVLQSYFPHQWFLCMWTSGQSDRLWKWSRNYEAVIVIGCDSATITVRKAVHSNCSKIIEGMTVAGIMNAKLSFQFPCSIRFVNSEVVLISQDNEKSGCDREIKSH